ncbi:MAG: hypothetical protein IT384_04350 [Deltaproteobacteria bacterium]|nr:hypothetical protein [Deltaproteobacteria bacterium]
MGWFIELFAPGAGGAFNDWRLIASTTLSVEWRVALAVLIGVAFVLSALGLSGVGRRRRRLLLVLRAVAAAAVLGLILMPAIELRAVSKVRSRIALLVDASRSMSLATPSGTRAERVAQHLSESQAELDRLAREAVLERALFGERLRLVDAFPAPLPTEERRTDLARALLDVSAQSSGRELGAVVLYSDGTDTEGLTVDRAREIGAALGAPIYAVGFSAESAAADLAIRRVSGDDFAFVHNTVSLDVDLEQRGLDLKGTAVTLKRDGNVVSSKEATFDARGRATVTFEFKPTRIGKTAYQVSVPVQPGEAVITNNARSIVLKVIRDRIRVLQVAGRPSWDERFLRELLKRNPNVDLISFFILRSTTDLQKSTQDELALIPFPVNELFTKELPSFDVVIYQNFTYRPYRMAHYLQNIQEYVTHGGGFLMIGGNESFEDGWYAGTPVGDVLPVRLGGAPAWDEAEYRPRLTREGRLHPISLIGEPGEPPEAVFQRLPPLAGFNVSLGLQSNAQALLVHPSLPGNPPIVAIREVGEGRTMSVATDSLWFWRFIAVGDGGAGREFDRFWNAALRWLIRDPELARVRVETDRGVHLLGDPITARVRVLAADYRGLADADVVLDIVPADPGTGSGSGSGGGSGSGSGGGTDTGQARAPLSARTDADGNATIDLGALQPGTYLLRAAARSGDERVGAAEEPLIVEAADVELQAPFPRPEILSALAESSGGRFVDVSESLGRVRIKDSRRVEVDRSRVIPIWDTLPAFLLLLAVLSAEWWIRRRSGLL